MKICLQIIFFFSLWSIGSLVFAQRGQQSFPGGFSDGGGSNKEPTSLGEFVEDTSSIFFFFADNPNLIFPYSDSLLHNFQQYDPVRQRDFDFAHLGHLGSAHRPIVYQTTFQRGLDIGLHQYDLYQIRADKLPYYNITSSYTDLAYSQGSEQSDAYFRSKFSRNFKNGLNFSLNYKRNSYLGEANHYAHQKNRNTAIALGMWYHSENNRYNGFFSFAANTHEQEDNGGIEVEPVVSDEVTYQSSSATVFSESAQTRHAHRELAYTHYYQMQAKEDSLKTNRRKYTLSHRFLYSSSKYKFYDENSDGNTSFYPLLYQVDSRGMRQYIEAQKIENAFNISTFKLNTAKVKSQRDLLEVGIVHTYHSLHEEPADSTLNNLFLTGKWLLKPSERLNISTYAHLGLFAHAGDYRVEGNLFFDLKKAGNFRAQFVNQLNEPTLIQHRSFVSQRKVWGNDFNKTLQTSLSATYTLPWLKLEVSGKYHLFNNYIYFDTLSVPLQTGEPVSLLQLLVKKDFQVGSIHLDNILAFQESTTDYLRLPAFYSKHSLYYTGRWFKNVLDVSIGIDARLNSSHYADYYFPLTGQFHLQDDQNISFFPAVDAFFTMKVSRFRAYFKGENLTGLLDVTQLEELFGQRLYYQTARYAWPFPGFRFGISWRMMN